MRRERATLREIYLLHPDLPAGRIASTQAMIPAPGQFVMALHETEMAPRRIPLFPSAIHSDGFSSTLVPSHWRPGDRLDLLGPLGHGFSPAAASRRWLLASYLERQCALLPLIERGLETGAEIAYWGCSSTSLDPAVEVIADLTEGLRWAEYAALEINLESLEKLRELWRGVDAPPSAQVLLRTDLPCGFGACQACAAPWQRGVQLACVNGPVFDAHILR